jgi:hypothetical protein
MADRLKEDKQNSATEASTAFTPSLEEIALLQTKREFSERWGKSHKWIRVIIQTLTVICVIIGWISAIMFTGISNKLIDNQKQNMARAAETCVSPCTLSELTPPGYTDIINNTKTKCIEKSFENLISWVKTAAICTIIASSLQLIFLIFSEYPINQQSLPTLILYFLGWIVLIINIVVSSQLLGMFGRSIPAAIGVNSERCFILYSKDNLELSLKYYQWSIFFAGAVLMGMVFNESYGLRDFKAIFSKYSTGA